MISDADSLELENSFSEIANELFAVGTIAATLQRIVDLAERTVDGCDGAGIFLVNRGRATTAAASRALVITLDEIQIQTGEGPCLDASNAARTVYASDLTDDGRWLTFGPRAVAEGVRSVLAYSLSTHQPSALNLYGRLPHAFGATDRAKGQLFATLARLALESAEERNSESVRAANLNAALGTRELIGQAKGILMERERITAEQAFDVLRRASQHLNVKLREVAQRLVETGESPETETPQTLG